MKILMIRANQGFPDSRVEKEIFSLSKEHEVELLGWDRTHESEFIVEKRMKIGTKNIKIHHICISAPQGEGFAKTAVPMFKFWIHIRKYLVRHLNEYDTIHFCDFDTAALAFSYVRRHKKKIVYDIFDYYADAHSAPMAVINFIRKRENSFIRNADVVLLCSDKRVEQIKPVVPKKYAIIYNSPSKDMMISPISIPVEADNERLRIVYVGVLSDERYLKEVAEVVANNKSYEMHVAGFGALEMFFMDMAEKNNNIFYYGKISYAQALYLESKSTIMTALYDPRVPNHKFASPNKFFEALMLGKPLIMIKDTGMSEFVSNYHLGEIIDLNNKNFSLQFAEALEKIKKKDIMKISNNCRSLYEDKFSWSNMEQRLLEVYRCLE